MECFCYVRGRTCFPYWHPRWNVGTYPLDEFFLLKGVTHKNLRWVFALYIRWKKLSFLFFFIIGLVHTLAKNRSVGERGVPCIKYTSGTLHYILLPAGDSRSGQCWVYTGMKENKNIFSFIWNVFFSFLWVWTFTTIIIIIIMIIVVVVVVIVVIVVVVVVDNA